MVYKKGFGFVDEERPFNFAEKLLTRCDKLLSVCNEARSEGDVGMWYRNLASLASAVSPFLKNKEDEEIIKQLSNISGKIKNQRRQTKEVFYFQVEKALDEMERKIVKLMYKYELYYPRKEHKTDEEEMKEGYE